MCAHKLISIESHGVQSTILGKKKWCLFMKVATD